MSAAVEGRAFVSTPARQQYADAPRRGALLHGFLVYVEVGAGESAIASQHGYYVVSA